MTELHLRPAASRGQTRLGWLESRHSFSFGRYFDADRMGFHGLRVLNDDRVAPAAGFPEHPHDNMEILSWVIEGGLAHRDSTGAEAVLKPGDVQVMSAGQGIRHSEYNASRNEPVHFLQIWIEPAEADVPPRHEERTVPEANRRNRFAAIASPDGADGSIRIHADARVLVADLDADTTIDHPTLAGRATYLHVVRGQVEVNGQELSSGDAAAAEEPGGLRIRAAAASQIMLFDLAQAG